MPFQGADGDVDDRAGLARRHDLGGAQAFVADLLLGFVHGSSEEIT